MDDTISIECATIRPCDNDGGRLPIQIIIHAQSRSSVAKGDNATLFRQGCRFIL